MFWGVFVGGFWADFVFQCLFPISCANTTFFCFYNNLTSFKCTEHYYEPEMILLLKTLHVLFTNIIIITFVHIINIHI